MGAFKAYDIRGIYNKDFNKDTVYKIGFFLPKLLKADVIAVGRDVRTSSDEIFEYLCKGITDAGSDVWNIGLATTPFVYFSTVFLKVKASVQITASHNPKEYNGLKISREKAVPVGIDTGLKELQQMVENEEITVVEKKGKVINKDIKPDYLEFQKQFLPDLSGLKLAFDCSHGMANLFVKDLFGNEPSYIYDHFDGTFPAHEPNPLDEKNCRDLEKLVLKTKSDIGIIYDGDADRVMFIDEKGRFIQPDYVTAIIGKYFLNKGKGKVLVDIRTSRSTTEYLKRLGATEIIVWKVGHAYAKVRIREDHCIFGGELAGHYYFRDFFNCDSGILASIIVLQTLKQLKSENKTFSSLVDEIIAYSNSGEINFKLEQKDEAIQGILKKYKPLKPIKIYDFDGYRLEWEDWWFSIRKSNTEPYLRLVMEAKSKKLLKEKLDEITSIIKSYK